MSACLYVCMSVCLYVRTYVHTYVCTYVRRTYVCMYVCTYVRLYVCMYVRTSVCMYVRMYVCMYACIYVYMYRWTAGIGLQSPHMGFWAMNSMPAPSSLALGDARCRQRGQRGGSSPWNSRQLAVIQHHQACRIFTFLLMCKDIIDTCFSTWAITICLWRCTPTINTCFSMQNYYRYMPLNRHTAFQCA